MQIQKPPRSRPIAPSTPYTAPRSSIRLIDAYLRQPAPSHPTALPRPHSPTTPCDLQLAAQLRKQRFQGRMLGKELMRSTNSSLLHTRTPPTASKLTHQDTNPQNWTSSSCLAALSREVEEQREIISLQEQLIAKLTAKLEERGGAGWNPEAAEGLQVFGKLRRVRELLQSAAE